MAYWPRCPGDTRCHSAREAVRASAASRRENRPAGDCRTPRRDETAPALPERQTLRRQTRCSGRPPACYRWAIPAPPVGGSCRQSGRVVARNTGAGLARAVLDGGAGSRGGTVGWSCVCFRLRAAQIGVAKRAVQYNLRAKTVQPMSEITHAEATPAESARVTMDIHEIQRILPHRYPFLLIDRVIDLTRRERIVAIKNVTMNEPFFQGHFPNLPIMPGVLIVEAIAQAGGALLLTEVEDRSDKVMVFTGIERAKFRKPVTPGDQLRLEVELKGWREVPGMTAAKMQGYAFVGDRKVAEAMVSCQLVHASRGRGSNDAAE